MKYYWIVVLLCLPFSISAQNPELDPDFGEGGILIQDFEGTSNEGGKSIILPSGKILIAGKSPFNGLRLAIAQFMPDGQLDSSFGTDGLVDYFMDVTCNQVIRLSDGKILVGGYSGTSSNTRIFGFTRLLQDGSIDTDFGDNGVAFFSGQTTFGVQDMIQQEDGKIVFCGTSQSSFNPFVGRINEDGSTDTSFGDDGVIVFETGNNTSRFAWGMDMDDDETLYVCGETNNQNQSTGADFFKNWIGKINPDGTSEFKFLSSSDENNEQIRDIKVMPNGNIAITGGWSNGDKRSIALGTYNTTLEEISFSLITTDDTDDGYAFTFQEDGKILVTGERSRSGGSRFLLGRFNEDGSVDTSFGDNGSFEIDIDRRDDKPVSIHALSDNKVLVTGQTGTSSRTFQYALVQLITDLSASDNELTDIVNAVHVYPNPVIEELNLEIDMALDEELKISLYSKNGLLLSTLKPYRRYVSGTHKFTIKINESLSPDLYFLVIEDILMKRKVLPVFKSE